jgi:hypothetical protein
MTDDFDMELIDGRDALGVIVFRDEGDQIATEIKAMKISKLDMAKLCIQLGRSLKAQHDAEQADRHE